MKHLKIALALSITISLLSGCSNGTPDSWKFSKEDVDNFMVVDSQLIKPDDNDSKVKIIIDIFLFVKLDDVSFKIYRGETVGLVGESGCGKTTLGRTILQLYTPTAGKISFNGIRVNPPSKLDIEAVLKRKDEAKFKNFI